MKVTAIMATCGRHKCAERALGMFIQQDYPYKHLLIYQNSPVEQELHYKNHFPVTLINNSGPFTSLGHIYTEALKHVPEDTDLICFWDDDDLYLQNHILEGVSGYERAAASGRKAYKPSKSYYRDPRGLTLMSNTLEPSIFVEYSHIKEYGFSDTTTQQHLQWVDPLVQNDLIFVDPEGLPTLIYNWGDVHIPTYKTSGDYNNPKNFENCRRESKDHGDRILTPNFNLEPYYNLANAKYRTSPDEGFHVP